MRNNTFDVILLEKPGCKGLTKADVMRIYSLLSGPEAFPIEIGDVLGNGWAMGFITSKAAETLQYEYGQDSELGEFISSILDDMNEESDDDIYEFKYEFKGLRIYLTKVLK